MTPGVLYSIHTLLVAIIRMRRVRQAEHFVLPCVQLLSSRRRCLYSQGQLTLGSCTVALFAAFESTILCGARSSAECAKAGSHTPSALESPASIVSMEMSSVSVDTSDPVDSLGVVSSTPSISMTPSLQSSSGALADATTVSSSLNASTRGLLRLVRRPTSCPGRLWRAAVFFMFSCFSFSFCSSSCIFDLSSAHPSL